MSRFEDLNATVLWTVACRQLDGGNTLNFLPIGKKIANESRHSDFHPPLSIVSNKYKKAETVFTVSAFFFSNERFEHSNAARMSTAGEG